MAGRRRARRRDRRPRAGGLGGGRGVGRCLRSGDHHAAPPGPRGGVRAGQPRPVPQAQRRARAAGHPGRLRGRPLPDPLPPGALPRGRPAAAHRRRDRHPGPAQRPGRRADPPARAGLRDPGRARHPGPRRPAVAGAVLAVGPLRGRHARAADPGRLPSRLGAGSVDPQRHRPLPPCDERDPQAGLRLLGRPRARRHAVGRAGRRHRGPEALGRLARPRDRSGRAAAGPGGLLAAAPGGCGVPRRRRGHRDVRGGRRAAGR